jgi:hypothetical protein
MQKLLLFTLIAAVALAGCAENTGDDGGGDARPPAQVSTSEAQALFASAAENVPERYGMDMVAKNATTTVMTAQAVYDEPAQTAYFRMEMDPSVFEDMGDGMSMTGGDAEAFQNIGVYMSPQGNAFLVNGTVMLAPAEEGQFDQATGEQEGFDALSDPEAFLGELKENNFTVHTVTPTTLRGKGALKLDATIVEEGVTQNMTVWLFQNPTRIARVETAMPAEADDEEENPFGDATMTIDMLYDEEVTLEVPADLQRALGLRYQSDRSAFSFGDDEEGPETWTFQVDGGLALSEIQAEVGGFDEGEEPEWVMLLSEGTKTQDGVTITFEDADSDGKVSANDTLTIDRGDGFAQVSLRDNVTGLRVVPGLGLLLAALAVAAACGVTRRN